MPFLHTRDDVQLFYRDWGAGLPIVFLASQSVSSEIWNYNLPFFTARGFRCIAFDRRGHGRSDQPGGGYDLDSLADDLSDVLARLDLRGVTLVGHSLGGAEVIRYLARHRAQRVRRAVLLAPTAPFMTKTDDNPNGIDPAFFDAAAKTWSKDFPRWVAENTRPFFAPDTSPEMMQWGASLMLSMQLDVLLKVARASTRSDLRADLDAITTPALVLHGDADASVPVAFGRLTAERLRKSRFKLYEGAAHGLFITHAEQVNNDILEFLGA